MSVWGSRKVRTRHLCSYHHCGHKRKKHITRHCGRGCGSLGFNNTLFPYFLAVVKGGNGAGDLEDAAKGGWYERMGRKSHVTPK